MPKDTGEFIISKSMNLRLPPIFGYTAFLFIPRQVRFLQSLSHLVINVFALVMIRVCGSTLYVVEHAVLPTNTKFKPLILPTQTGMPYTNTHKHRTFYMYIHISGCS